MIDIEDIQLALTHNYLGHIQEVSNPDCNHNWMDFPVEEFDEKCHAHQEQDLKVNHFAMNADCHQKLQEINQ